MHKPLLLTGAVLFFAVAANAQITKGTLFLGGSLGLSSGKSESTPTQPGGTVQEAKSTNWAIRPQAGTAIADNTVAGIFLNFAKSKTDQKQGSDRSMEETSNNGGGVFYRYYYALSRRFFLFGEGTLGIAFNSYKVTLTNSTTSFMSVKGSGTGVGLNLTPGISFAASPKLHIEATLNNIVSFSHSTDERNNYDFRGTLQQTSENSYTSAGINANGFSNLYVGLRWFLPRKK